MCNWHRNQTFLKQVLKSLHHPEAGLVLSDHTVVMHRLDSPHTSHYKVVSNAVDADSDEMTLQAYLSSDTGKMWQDAEFLEQAQRYVAWMALQELAHEANRQLIKWQMPRSFDAAGTDVKQIVQFIRHGLLRINAFQVRGFVALLFRMCTVQDILEANEDTKVHDEELYRESDNAWACAWPMKLLFSAVDNEERRCPARMIETWCYPVWAPPSAMRFICTLCSVSASDCPWTIHSKMGVQCFEEAMTEKISLWLFWRGMQRFCPLVQYLPSTQSKTYMDELMDNGLMELLFKDVNLDLDQNAGIKMALGAHKLEREKKRIKRAKQTIRAAVASAARVSSNVRSKSAKAAEILSRLLHQLEQDDEVCICLAIMQQRVTTLTRVMRCQEKKDNESESGRERLNDEHIEVRCRPNCLANFQNLSNISGE